MSLRDTLKRLLEAAQRFEMKTPKYQRIDSERHGLREAITDAQLVLPVQELPEQKQKTAAPSLQAVPTRTSTQMNNHHCLRLPLRSSVSYDVGVAPIMVAFMAAKTNVRMLRCTV